MIKRRMIKRILLQSLRSKAFRLSLQSTFISGLGAMIICSIIYSAAGGAIRRELDRTVKNEQMEIISGSAGGQRNVTQSIREELSESNRTFYALLAPSGAMLAGNLRIPPALVRRWQGYKTLTRTDGLALPDHITAIRGLETTLQDGDRLYVAEEANGLLTLRYFFAHSLWLYLIGILVLAMAGGFLLARNALARVQAIAAASQEIIAGNLARRVAMDGSGDEFDRLALSLNMMLDQIEILMRNIQQVSNDISHDLRSPLARLRAGLEISRLDAPDARMERAFDEAIAQVDHVLGIFSAILRIAEIESRARRACFTQIRLTELLHDMTESFRIVALVERKYLEAELAPGLLVQGDGELLEQMFVNLIENAILYSPPGGHIRVRARAGRAGRVEIEITDQGPGIPAHERQRVLQRFVRLEPSRHREGSGLGLALVASIVALHDAIFRFEDNAPGLKILLRIPGAAEIPPPRAAA